MDDHLIWTLLMFIIGWVLVRHLGDICRGLRGILGEEEEDEPKEPEEKRPLIR